MQLSISLLVAAPLAIAALALASSNVPPRTPAAKPDGPPPVGSISKKEWGEHDGKPVYLWTLRNGKGLEAEITNYGTIIVSLKTPDTRGVAADIVLGRPSLKDYIERTQYFGCT
ncbi:MAG: hypothetical protein RIS45_63, partial [Planctomycetota bacterium]